MLLFKLFFIAISMHLNDLISVSGSKTIKNSTEIPTTEAVIADKSISKNGTKDLYVIRKVVYEIGILTDAENTTNFDNKTHEQIDVSFFDPIDNGTFVNLSNIPIPVETNVSGVAVTGILASPANFGNLIFPQNGSIALNNESSFPIFPDKQVKITRNISTSDKIQNANILSGISDILGIRNLLIQKNNASDEENPSK